MKKFKKSLIVLILLVTFAIISSIAITAAIKDNFKQADHRYFNYAFIDCPGDDHIQIYGTCTNWKTFKDNDCIQVTINDTVYLTSIDNVLLRYDPKREK